MRFNYLSGCLLLAVLLCLSVFAEDEVKKKNNRFVVNLDDGSEVICTPLIEEIPIKTSYAELKIPLRSRFFCNPTYSLIRSNTTTVSLME